MRTGVALAVAVAGAAGARAQTPSVSIEDVRVVEGSGGPWTQQVTVTLSEASLSTVEVPWHTVNGSAIGGADFDNDTGLIRFDSGVTTFMFPVVIRGDIDVEWNPTLQLDEAFFIALDPPVTMNATLLKSRATVTIVDDDRPTSVRPGLQFVSAVADSYAGAGRVRLQWRVPPPSATSGPPTDVLVRWNRGSGCAAPTDTTGSVSGEFRLSDPPTPIPLNPAGETQVVEHKDLQYDLYCYALFAMYSATTPTTEPATLVATPLNPVTVEGAAVAWSYSVAGSLPNVVPPTVGLDAVYTVSNDGVVHAMVRGEGGGGWPAGWNPVGLGKAASNRSPVVPLPYGPRYFVGTDSGEVHAVDAKNGSIAWSRSGRFSNALPNTPGAVQGTPAGLFTSFGGDNDAILVGTNRGPSGNTFFILDPMTGATGPPFSDGAMGGMLGMPAVDYLMHPNRVYFLTNSGTGTLWAFDLGVPGSPALAVPPGYPLNLAVGANGSPVLRNGRVYFGANTDLVVHRVSDGQTRSLNLGDGEIKGFVFPDRRSPDLYLSTGSTVWGVKDTLDTEPPPLTYLWSVTDIPTPSILLHRPNTNFLYVGGGDGRLYEIDVASGSPPTIPPAKKSVLLESNKQIGAPSLDGPNSLVHVGSASGVVYAVRVPLQ